MVTLSEDMAETVSTALLIGAARAQRESWDSAVSPTVRRQRAVYMARLDDIRAEVERQLRHL